MPENPAPVPDFQRLSAELLRRLPADAAERALGHFKGSFLKEGFTDYAFIAWPKRISDPWTGDTHKLLRKSNALRDSLRVVSRTMEKIEVQAGAGIPYAVIQNEGGTVMVPVTAQLRKFAWAMYYKHGKEGTAAGRWKALALTKKQTLRIKIPQRQYIGESELLLKNIEKALIADILKAFNGLSNGV